ncbi:MAG: radical SAM protein [Bacteroidota bacterium]
MNSVPRHFNIPIFVPELACPNRCVFCNQFYISGVIKQPSEKEIIQQINTYLSSIEEIKEETIVEIAFFGGNFTGIPIDIQENYLKLVQPYIESKRVHGIRISTRPDYIDEQRLALLKKYNVIAIEMGVQSLDEEVLIFSGRGHSINDVENAVELIKKYNFELGLQMMIGLPSDTKEKSMNTAQKIVDYKPSTVRIYPTLVIKNTALEQLYNNNLYKALSIDEAVNWTKDILLLFEKNKIRVIRTGLHPSEDFTNGNTMLAGPFHASFKELVISEIWLDIFKNCTFNFSHSEITICVSKIEINYAVGYKSKNKAWLQEKFKKVNFKENSSLTGRNYEVHYS